MLLFTSDVCCCFFGDILHSLQINIHITHTLTKPTQLATAATIIITIGCSFATSIVLRIFIVDASLTLYKIHWTDTIAMTSENCYRIVLLSLYFFFVPDEFYRVPYIWHTLNHVNMLISNCTSKHTHSHIQLNSNHISCLYAWRAKPIESASLSLSLSLSCQSLFYTCEIYICKISTICCTINWHWLVSFHISHGFAQNVQQTWKLNFREYFICTLIYIMHYNVFT